MSGKIVIFAVLFVGTQAFTNLQLKQCIETCPEKCTTEAAHDAAHQAAFRACANQFHTELAAAKAASNCSQLATPSPTANCIRHPEMAHTDDHHHHDVTGSTTTSQPGASTVSLSANHHHSDHHLNCTRHCKHDCHQQCTLDASAPAVDWHYCTAQDKKKQAFEDFHACVQNINIPVTTTASG